MNKKMDLISDFRIKMRVATFTNQSLGISNRTFKHFVSV